MTGPGTATTFSLATGVTLSSLVLGLDGNAAIGAFAGAVLMVMSSKDLHWYTRIVYLAISWIMGYIAAPELIDHLPIHETGVAAFFCAAVVVVIALQLIERVRSIDFLGWLRRNGGP